MPPLSHLSYPFLFFVLIANIFRIDYSFSDLLILMFFSALPDSDVLIFAIFNKKHKKFSLADFKNLIFVSTLPNFISLTKKIKDLKEDIHHHSWPTHIPIVYAPLVGLLFLLPNLKLILVCFAIYSHFILDSILGGGIMWLYPFSKRFFSFLPGGLKNYCGLAYFKAYKQTIFYKIDFFAFVILLIILLASFVEIAGFY